MENPFGKVVAGWWFVGCFFFGVGVFFMKFMYKTDEIGGLLLKWLKWFKQCYIFFYECRFASSHESWKTVEMIDSQCKTNSASPGLAYRISVQDTSIHLQFSRSLYFLFCAPCCWKFFFLFIYFSFGVRPPHLTVTHSLWLAMHFNIWWAEWRIAP